MQPFEPVWKHTFLTALARTGIAAEAARVAGIGVRNAFKRRKADATFALAWDSAIRAWRAERGRAALSAAQADGLMALPLGGGGARLVRASNSRWSPRAEEVFLLELGMSGNIRRSAAAAGVTPQAVYKRRLKDRHFAAAWDAALELGKVRVRGYLFAAAERTFDPEALPVGEGSADLPRVTIGEAIHIARLKGPGDGPAAGAAGAGARAAAGRGPAVASDEEVKQALIKRLAQFARRQAGASGSP